MATSVCAVGYIQLLDLDRWCKWCARWTENPEVLVQLKVGPQNSQVAQIFGKTNWLERYAEVIVVIGSSPVLTTFYGAYSSVG